MSTVARQFPGVNRLRGAEGCEMDTSLKGGFADRFRGSGRECGAQKRIIATSRRSSDPALRKTKSVLQSLNRLQKSHKHTACGIFLWCGVVGVWCGRRWSLWLVDRPRDSRGRRSLRTELRRENRRTVLEASTSSSLTGPVECQRPPMLQPLAKLRLRPDLAGRMETRPHADS